MNILSQLLYLDSLTEFNVAFHPSPAEKKEKSIIFASYFDMFSSSLSFKL